MGGREASEDALRKGALLACMLQTLIMSIIPGIEYYYVYRLDTMEIGPQAWTIWGVALFLGCLGVVAHSTASRLLTLLHIVAGCLLTAALAAFTTAWFFVLQLQCSVGQGAFTGCDLATCPCSATDTCSAQELAAVGCAACEAPSAELCAAMGQQLHTYLLAFTGLALLLAAVPALVLDVHVLLAATAQRSATAARRQAMRVSVDQQTRLVIAGDKPTVTPGTLRDWVSSLLATGDEVLVGSAEKCRAALRNRGYELPLRTASTKHAPPPAVTPGLFRAATGAAQDLASGGGSNPDGPGGGAADALYDAAEKGDGRGKKVRRQQITPEETPVTPGKGW